MKILKIVFIISVLLNSSILSICNPLNFLSRFGQAIGVWPKELSYRTALLTKDDQLTKDLYDSLKDKVDKILQDEKLSETEKDILSRSLEKIEKLSRDEITEVEKDNESGDIHLKITKAHSSKQPSFVEETLKNLITLITDQPEEVPQETTKEVLKAIVKKLKKTELDKQIEKSPIIEEALEVTKSSIVNQKRNVQWLASLTALVLWFVGTQIHNYVKS